MVCSNCHEPPENHLRRLRSLPHAQGLGQSASFLVSLAPTDRARRGGARRLSACATIQTGKSNRRRPTTTDYVNEQCTLCHKAEQ